MKIKGQMFSNRAPGSVVLLPLESVQPPSLLATTMSLLHPALTVLVEPRTSLCILVSEQHTRPPAHTLDRTASQGNPLSQYPGFFSGSP